MVRDAVTWKENFGTLKLYYDVRNPNMAAGFGPGTGVLRTAPSRYYWMVNTAAEGKPDEVRGFTSAMDVNFPRQPFGPMANAIKRNLTTSPKLSKLIVWDSLLPRKLDLTDKVLDMLGPDWKRESDEVFYAAITGHGRTCSRSGGACT